MELRHVLVTIIFTNPWYYIPFMILISSAAGYFLYKKSPIPFETHHQVKNYIFVFFRSLLLFLLFLIWFNPLIKTETHRTEKPVLIYALDGSMSITANKDSNYYRTQFLDNYKKLSQSLSDKFNTELLVFGDQPYPYHDSLIYTLRQTSYSKLWNEIRSRYDNRNIGAVVLASDGIYNAGLNPVNESALLRYPVYTIGMGDTLPARDVKIKKVRYNEFSFLGNDMPVVVEMASHGYPGKKSAVKITEPGGIVYSQDIQFTGNSEHREISFMLKADKPGIHHYIVSISYQEKEITYNNNISHIFIEVLDGKQKIALVAAAPHPDIAAIKSAIEQNKNFELELYMLSQAGKIKNPSRYNLVIFHQIPAISNPATLLVNQFKSAGIPQWYIAGVSSQLQILSQVQNNISVSGMAGKYNDITPVLQHDFGLFTLPEATQKLIEGCPPLAVPFGNYMAGTTADIFLTQQNGRVKTSEPLMAFGNGIDTRSATLLGEGLWRWRMYDYSLHGNTQAFDDLIWKCLRYLAVKEDKKPFRLVGMSSGFDENEPVIMNAEFHNETWEMINDPDAFLEIYNQEKNKYSFTFSKSGRGYTLDAGKFPPGNYTYHAYMTHNNKKHIINGTFTVTALQGELLNTLANHDLLKSIAFNTGGKMVLPKQMDEINNYITQNPEIKPVIYEDKETHELIHYKIIFILMVILATIEWGVRKYYGVV